MLNNLMVKTLLGILGETERFAFVQLTPEPIDYLEWYEFSAKAGCRWRTNLLFTSH